MVDPVLDAAENAPEDDEPISKHAVKALKEAREERARGEGVPDDELEKHLDVWAGGSNGCREPSRISAS